MSDCVRRSADIHHHAARETRIQAMFQDVGFHSSDLESSSSSSPDALSPGNASIKFLSRLSRNADLDMQQPGLVTGQVRNYCWILIGL